MAKRNFPNWLKAYVEYTQHSEAPDSFHFWVGVSVIAGALRRHVWIEEEIFQITPNFYIIIVAPPGIATKSTSIGIGMNLLGRLPGIKFGPNSMTWQGLSIALEESLEAFLPDGADLPYQCSALTISISELGTFLRPKDNELIDFLVDMWDGKLGIWEHRIKTGDKPSTRIKNPWINLIGCTTPAWLRGNFPKYMIDGGLTSRCIFLYADRKRKLVPRPSRVINHEWFRDFGNRLTEDLESISQLYGEYKYTPEAEDWYIKWYERHWLGKPTAFASDRYGGYVSRKQTHLQKTAMIIAASRRNELIIDLEDIQLADYMVTGNETNLKAAFDIIGISDNGRNELEVIAVLRVMREASIQELWKQTSRYMDRKSFDEAVKSLVLSGLITSISVDGMMGFAITAQAERPLVEETPLEIKV